MYFLTMIFGLVAILKFSKVIFHPSKSNLEEICISSISFRVLGHTSIFVLLRLGHAQFLHYFIKKDKKFFKKRFGVQFLLDVIRKYLSSEDLTNSDATKTVRITIIGIINYYIQKEINVQEMTAILNYMLVARRDFQVRNCFL